MQEKINQRERNQLNKVVQAGLSYTNSKLRMLLGEETWLQVCEQPLAGLQVQVRLGLSGALPGQVILLLPESFAEKIVKRLVGGSRSNLLSEEARSVLMEFGNIFASSFVAYFDDVYGFRTLPTPPELSLVGQALTAFDARTVASLRWQAVHARSLVCIDFKQPALDILLAN